MMRWLASMMVVALGSSCSAFTSTGDLPPGGGGDADGGPRRDSGPGRRDAGPSGEDAGPTCPAPCDDGVECTIDQCVGGSCTASPDSSMCAGGLLCDPVMGCVERRCASDAECDDGQPCNGAERCDAAAPGNGCVEGAAPTCDDGIACTEDSCVDPTGCVAEPRDTRCTDRVSCSIDSCNPASDLADEEGCVYQADDSLCMGNFCDGVQCVLDGAAPGCHSVAVPDCRDGNPCTNDACDRTAEMCVSVPRDGDGDGYPAASVSGVACMGGTDCNDGSAAVHPGATEVCGNGIDEDCMGGDPPCPGRMGETCASAIPITLDGSGSFSVTGSTWMFTNDVRSRCSGGDARDVVYSLTLSAARDVIIDTVGSMFDTVLAVQTSCPGDVVVCDDDLRSGDGVTDLDSRVFVRNVGGGPLPIGTTLYIIVDGYNTGDAGTYTLNVRTQAPVLSSCNMVAADRALDISSGGTVYGTIPLRNDQRGTCGGALGGEDSVVFRTAGAGDGRDAVLTGNGVGRLALYSRYGAGCMSPEEACQTNGGGGTVNLTIGDVRDGAHWVFIDGDMGPYTLDYSPPRP